MEKKFIINDCSLIPSEGSSLKQESNIAGGNPTITYFESIKSPAISLSLNIIDVDQLISREGITGGEYLSLRIKSDPFSPIIIVAALVLPDTILGIIEASTTLKFSIPCTFNSGSTLL